MIPHVTKGGDIRGLLGYLTGVNPGRANRREPARGRGRRVPGQLVRRAAAAATKAVPTSRSTWTGPARATGWRARHGVASARNRRREAVLGGDGGRGPGSRTCGTLACAWPRVSSCPAPSGAAWPTTSPPGWASPTSDGQRRCGGSRSTTVRARAATTTCTSRPAWSVRTAPGGGPLPGLARAQTVCRALEAKHGLPGRGRRARHRHPGREAGRVGPGERRPAVIAREDIAQRVRAAAVASASEAEWVRRVRGSGVVIKPRFAAGSTDVVVGYRAALSSDRGGWARAG